MEPLPKTKTNFDNSETTKKVGTVCTPSPQNNEFKMITNYIVLAHVSFNATVRLKTK